MSLEYIIAAGKYQIAGHPTKLKCVGLGSCVAIALYDWTHKMGGLSHAMLPFFSDGIDKKNPGKYVDTAIYLMVDEMLEQGIRKGNIKARLIGGAQMFSYISSANLDIGSQNINSARETLEKEKIKIIEEELGGTKGRTLTFDISTGAIEVLTSGKKIKIM